MKYDIVKTQDGFHVTETPTGEKFEKLPPGVYFVDHDKENDRYLLKKDLEKYKVPEVIFGDKIHTRTTNVVDEFHKGDSSLGVMAVGDKGCGKSEHVFLTGNKMIEKGYPVIEFRSYTPEHVVRRIVDSAGPCMFVGDEFGKEHMWSPMHKEGDRSNDLLNTFSNKNISKTLWFITENKMALLSPYIRERTGRFLYRWMFRGTAEDVVRSIAKHHKLSEEFETFLVDHAKATYESIDNLITLAKKAMSCKTMNEFQSIFEDLNVRPPRFIRYSIGTDKEDKISAEIDGDKIIFRTEGDSGKMKHTYELEDIKKHRNQRGTLDGVNYKIIMEKQDEKPESKYECAIKTLPEKEFMGGFWF
tara:strand:- start:209688 stop:210764 length:1077 start_codon:yes stop_codon:yes gene_type:complete